MKICNLQFSAGIISGVTIWLQRQLQVCLPLIAVCMIWNNILCQYETSTETFS